MKKVSRLIEIKRQLGLTKIKQAKVVAKEKRLLEEREAIVKSFTLAEKQLYKEKIERACK